MRGRMPFPATWFTLCHVDSSRKIGSRGVARSYSQTDGYFWCSLSGRWSNGDDASRNLRHAKFSSLLESFVAPETSWMQDGGGTRQCSLASCTSPAPLAQQTSSCLAAGFPATLQSRPEPGGTGLEIDPPSVHAQCLFPDDSEAGYCYSNTICKVVPTQSPVAPIMRNYLRRYV
ncbi:MAG: hypothetical protein FD159_2637 [Syntrophaceae bacterium]|nr:MAG: hypothetical protein FD159_2637 [Syntrophaceae bacterium]